MEVKSIFNNSWDEIKGVSVAIAKPNHRNAQLHTGLFYLSASGKPKFLHLAWHKDLRNEEPRDKYLWLDSVLDPINQTHLATICQLIYDSNNDGIPYSICMNGTGFAKDGRFTAEEQYAGLTCATFVVQIFHSQRYDIIDFDKWKHVKSDKVWQRQIVQKLEEGVKFGRVSKEHIKYQRKKIQEGAARFKLEQVAAAVALPNPPHGAEQIKRPADRIRNLVNTHADKLSESRR